jgi:hypothetical protein
MSQVLVGTNSHNATEGAKFRLEYQVVNGSQRGLFDWTPTVGQTNEQLMAALLTEVIAVLLARHGLTVTEADIIVLGPPAFYPELGVLTFVIDGSGAEITTGIKGDIGPIPFPITITKATLLGDQTGSIVIDIWKDSYTNYPPTNEDSITASAPPTLSSAAKSQDTTLTGWTVLIAAGSILRMNVDSVTTTQRVTLALEYKRT